MGGFKVEGLSGRVKDVLSLRRDNITRPKGIPM